MPENNKMEVALRFLLGGMSSSIGSFVVHPMDTVKVRLQLDNELSGKVNIFKDRYYKGIVRGALRMCQEEGIFSIYRGITASMIREMTYTSIRAGCYEPIKGLLGEKDRHTTTLSIKLQAGAAAGLLGSAFTTPTDIVKVRLQADGLNNKPRSYRGTADCFLHVYRTQGFTGLFTGATPNMVRAVCLTSMQFPVYDHVKHSLMNHKLMEEGLPLHFVSAMVSGLASAVAANPADIVKTRIMNQKSQENRYRSPMDTFVKTLKSEGPFGLFKGTIASWMRLGPGITIYFLVFEQLRRLLGVNPI